jgi:hypothetical protein
LTIKVTEDSREIQRALTIRLNVEGAEDFVIGWSTVKRSFAPSRLMIKYTQHGDNPVQVALVLSGQQRLKSGELSNKEPLFEELGKYRSDPPEWVEKLVEQYMPVSI